ncbi:MAG: flavodoxin [Promethearchaeota archaeon]|nr:MAG: flavodoxin [Candidatus Lokiarchaeota archaeon]
MKIVILNGSPKGDLSVTMQYILYAKKKIPEHDYKILNVAQQVNNLVKNDEKLKEFLEEIEGADAVIWGFPLYAMLISSQFKRFIELIFEKNLTDAFRDKYTMSLMTSIHFFDNTAEHYMHGICDDLEMRFVDFFSADSWDLLYPKERALWIQFIRIFFEAVETKVPTLRQYPQITTKEFDYLPGEIQNGEKKVDPGNKKIIVVSDSTDENTNLGKMIMRFQKSFSKNIEVINLHDIDIKGPCLGCVKCGYNHECVYSGKDGFQEFWEDKLMKSDVIIFAGAIKDRFLSSTWKMVYDRAFYNTHTPTLIGKQMGYIISGPLSQIPNLKEMMQAYVEIQMANLVGFVTDEYGDSSEIDALLHHLAHKSVKYAELNLIKPQTFLGVGGTKIFRDDVYGRNRFVFLADHEWYEEHGIYDTFPQNDKRAAEMNKKLIPLIKIDKVRNKMDFKQEFLKPFKRVIEDPRK